MNEGGFLLLCCSTQECYKCPNFSSQSSNSVNKGRREMGIQGLLPLLKSTMSPIHVKDLKGSSVAVDTYSWLHMGALSCSTQLCKGLPTSRHIEYCMHRVNLLRHYGVKPVLVFDGGFLPMKIEQENKRARSRKENLARAIEHESSGNSAAAYKCYQKAVDISPLIAHELIQVLKQENVSYIVAPYEADSQMTFLAISKQVDAVITEDSDLIPFGCPRIIFKMDKYGQGFEFQYSRLQQNKDLSFSGFNNDMLLEMCILSGCDYLPSLPGMGLKRAHALITKFKSYDKVIKHLRYSTVCVPPLYEESFKKAILTFRHQRVYDPITEDIVPLSNVSDDLGDDLDFLGPLMPQHIAKGIAQGDLDPFTQMPFKGGNASSQVVPTETSKLKNFKPENGKKKLDLPVQKNLLTKYFCFASLEAKRKFRAPRTSPVNPSPEDNSSSSPDECCCEEAATGSVSSASPLEFENVRSSPSKDAVESGSEDGILGCSDSPNPATTNEKGHAKCALLQQFGQSIHKPFQASLKEGDCENVLASCHGKTRTENIKVIKRSSYFQNKSANKNHQDNKQERLVVKDAVTHSMCEDTILQGSLVNGGMPDDRSEYILENSYNSETMTKKVLLRSPYFLQKPVNKGDQDSKEDRPFVNDNVSNDMVDDIVLESASEGIYVDDIPMKRKTSLDETVQQENMKYKHMRTNPLVPSDGCCDENLDDALIETKTEEGKFGSDISHLSSYSKIAEKSMDKFVSMVSSFKYTSGSRASGLRAPLKDIRNTCTNRSIVDADFSQFTYVPSNQKTTAALRRR